MGLGLLLLILSGPWLVDWALPFFGGPFGFLDFNIYVVFGPQHNASDILDLNI